MKNLQRLFGRDATRALEGMKTLEGIKTEAGMKTQMRRGKSRVNCTVCVFITAGPILKLFAWGEGESGGHVLRETTSRVQCGLVCPSRTSELGGEGDRVKEGGGEEGEREKERAVKVRLRYSLG